MKRFVLAAILFLTALRVVLVCLEEPSPREAYYYLCSQQPASAYFDGPAGTAFLTGLLRSINSSDLLWRLSAPFWALAASAACFALVRRFADANRAALAVLSLNFLPVFNECALRVRPELPALAFVALGLLFSWKAFEKTSGASVFYWAFAGLFFGTASFFSYSAIVAIPGVALFALCSPKHRRFVDFVGLAALFAVPVPIVWPALQWNAEQEWIPIAGGTLQTLWMFSFGGFYFAVERLMLAFSPLFLIGLFIAFGWCWRECRGHLRPRYVFLATLPFVGLCVYYSLRGEDPVFYLLLASSLLLFKAAEWISAKPYGRTVLGAAFVLGAFFSGLTSFMVFQEGQGWLRVAHEVRDVFLEKSAQGEDGLFLIGGTEDTAAALGYALRDDLIPPPGHPAVYVRESQDISSQFGIWKSYDDFVESDKVTDEYFTEQKGENPFVNRSALYVTHESPNDVPQTIKAAFEAVTLLKTLPPCGKSPEPLYIYFCLHYQTLPL
ncbi:hypothetical protein BH09VER1_BH09VER1_29150 [soil metagenome]